MKNIVKRKSKTSEIHGDAHLQVASNFGDSKGFVRNLPSSADTATQSCHQGPFGGNAQLRTQWVNQANPMKFMATLTRVIFTNLWEPPGPDVVTFEGLRASRPPKHLYFYGLGGTVIVGNFNLPAGHHPLVATLIFKMLQLGTNRIPGMRNLCDRYAKGMRKV